MINFLWIKFTKASKLITVSIIQLTITIPFKLLGCILHEFRPRCDSTSPRCAIFTPDPYLLTFFAVPFSTGLSSKSLLLLSPSSKLFNSAQIHYPYHLQSSPYLPRHQHLPPWILINHLIVSVLSLPPVSLLALYC